MTKQRMDLPTWLKSAGFDTHPFAEQVADNDPHLPDYFVEYPYFEQISSPIYPRTAFLFARRGYGKSTNRRMIEYFTRHNERLEQVLAIPYTDFSVVVEGEENDLISISPRIHVREILRRGMTQLFELLIQQPRLAEQVLKDDPNLRVYIGRYSGYLDENALNRLLRKIGGISETVNLSILRRVMQKGENLRDFLGEVNPLFIPVIQLLTFIAGQETNEPARPIVSFVDQLQDFAKLLEPFGKNMVYVLVDGVDGFSNDINAGVELLQPLLSNLPLLEIPNAVFKFFVPAEIEAEVLHSTRPDRFEAYEIKWTDAELNNILRHRIEVTSGGRIKSLNQISRAKDLDEELVQNAAGSPRNLILLGKLLFSEHCRVPGNHFLLTREDWQNALNYYHRVVTPTD